MTKTPLYIEYYNFTLILKKKKPNHKELLSNMWNANL